MAQRYITPEQAASFDWIVGQLQDLQTKAHKAGLHVTSHAINQAMNAAGWEYAGEIEIAGKAARGETIGDRR